MTVMNIFSLLGGLGLFLFGMRIMGEGLERAAGNRLKKLLEVVTHNRLLAVLAGIVITAVIQSSSATTVMVVGFVNAGLLTPMMASRNSCQSRSGAMAEDMVFMPTNRMPRPMVT